MAHFTVGQINNIIARTNELRAQRAEKQKAEEEARVEANRQIFEQSKPANQLNTYNPSVARARAAAAQNRVQEAQNAENRARAVYSRENELAEDTLGESDVYAANKAAGVEATYSAQKQNERQGVDVIGVPNPVTQKLTLQNTPTVSSAPAVSVRWLNLGFKKFQYSRERANAAMKAPRPSRHSPSRRSGSPARKLAYHPVRPSWRVEALI